MRKQSDSHGPMGRLPFAISRNTARDQSAAAWADNTVRQLSRKSELAAAFRYMRARWTALVELTTARPTEIHRR
jgi:hypothetical protein